MSSDSVEVVNLSQATAANSNLDIDSDDEINNVPAQNGVYIAGLSSVGGLHVHRCIECNIVPFSEVYQCRNGHLVCAGCYQIRVLDKMLGGLLGTCSQCGVRIRRHGADRNVRIEQELAAVIVACEKCDMHLQRSQLHDHVRQSCCNRLTTCKYKRLGCKWKGKVGVLEEAHNENCEFRHKTAVELLRDLREIQQSRDAKIALKANVMKFLQLPQITVRLVHFMPSDGPYAPNCPTVGRVFDAFTLNWSIVFKWQTPDNVEEPNETQTDPCALLFQLCLEYCDADRGPLGLTYTLLSSIYSDIRFQPNLCEKHDFTRENKLGPSTVVYESSWGNMDTLLNKRGFYARLLMART